MIFFCIRFSIVLGDIREISSSLNTLYLSSQRLCFTVVLNRDLVVSHVDPS